MKVFVFSVIKELRFFMPIAFLLLLAPAVSAQQIATTTLDLTSCGDTIVSGSEECDVPGETGTYSTSIAGRQCNSECEYGPYCGDGIMQTIYDEECDDSNNTSGDFCDVDCTTEPASGGGGGGGSSGGGSSSGGSNSDNGETLIKVDGMGYPNRTVNVLLDGDSVGSVKAGRTGDFEFSLESDPGPVTLGFYSTDAFSTRSITYTTTFDVTLGAVTNVSNLLLPPTIKVSSAELNPGDIVTISGQAPPTKDVQIYLDDGKIMETQSDSQGDWSVAYDTTSLKAAEYTLKARYVTGSGLLTTDSGYSSSLALFVGVDGTATTPSDLNRDGFINLIDFSILIFWWGTTGGNSNPPADINGNGNVGLEDFSILLFNWTG